MSDRQMHPTIAHVNYRLPRGAGNQKRPKTVHNNARSVADEARGEEQIRWMAGKTAHWQSHNRGGAGVVAIARASREN